MSLERKLASALFAIGTFAASLNAALTATRYDVVNIGALTAMPYSAGVSVSNSGFVAGLGSNGVNFQQGFSWREDTGIQWLSFPSGAGQSVADAVNNAGQVVGTSFEPSHGVLWNANGSVANVFQSAAIDQPTGLNNSGLVTGYRNTVNSQTAYVWGGSYTDLGYPSPATSSQGYDVNDLGQVAGHLNGGQAFGAFASAPAAFLWSPNSGFTTIITSQSFTHIALQDLSDQAMVVGIGYWNGGANSLGWRWNALTGFSSLSSLPSAISTGANAVNDSGMIVGTSGGFGTIWDQQGNIYKANDLLAPGFADWNIIALRGINNNGWLTGEATLPGGANSYAVLLRPVPEPTSSGLILLSFASLSARRIKFCR